MALEKEPLVYIDGEYYSKSQAKISVFDHGLLYGDGVFEGIRAYKGVVFKLKEHIDRLYNSAKAIMLNIPMTKEEMINAVLETLRKNGLRDAYVRLVVTRGVGDLGLDPRKCPKPTVIIIADTIKLYSKEERERGIKALIVWVRRNPVDAASHEIKSLNYLNSVLGKIEANLAGFDEAICLDKNGHISEGVGENLFIVKNGKIITPPPSTGLLTGITRDVIIRLAEKMGYPVIERNITPTELFTADEAFFTGTAAEVTPIAQVNGRIIGEGKPGPITRRLMSEFEKLLGDPAEGVPIFP
ncbi:MAG: branched-chain-amino-acid transaminase [Nitrososphaerota archaeon]|nr:branched-chain-amino-acid transaminase [Candidatus Bathyarchaeota archaeon]MDW8023073.1 branched-chain-amino-acid transaminase [Nitrososphaerota archaeon]